MRATDLDEKLFRECCFFGFYGSESSTGGNWMERIVSRVGGINYNLASKLHKPAVANVLKRVKTLQPTDEILTKNFLPFCLVQKQDMTHHQTYNQRQNQRQS